MTPFFTIRPFADSDLASVLAIQHENSSAAQWAESDYTRLARDPAGLVLVAEPSAVGSERREVVGFAAFHRVLDEAELRNMAVTAGYRRHGAGKALLAEAHRKLLALGVKRAYLEVRAGNAAAIRLYESVGYRRLSIRRDYYQDPPEDACVMELIHCAIDPLSH
jgi:ribosomal-protein-alanine N-acetyltransferase